MHVLNTENKLQSLQCILYTQKQVDIISIHVFFKSDNNCNYFKAYFKHRKQIAIIFMYVLNKDNKLKLFFLIAIISMHFLNTDNKLQIFQYMACVLFPM